MYNQSVAELLLYVSAVVYTRDTSLYAKAEGFYKSLAAVNGSALPCRPFLGDLSESSREPFLELFSASEARIHKLSSSLGLSSSTISELDSGYGGPFASMFWSKQIDHPFLILAIKGTSVFDAHEWLIDTALQKVIMNNYILQDL